MRHAAFRRHFWSLYRSGAATRLAALALPLLALLNVILALVPCGNCLGQTFWTDGTGNWNTPSNWTLGVPNSASATAFDAVIENGGTAQLLAPPSGSVRRFRVGRAAGTGNVLVDASTLTVTQDLFVNENSAGPSSITVRNGSNVTAPTTSVGQISSANTSLSINGAGTNYTASTQFILGNSGAGMAALTLDTGALLISGTSIIGNGAGSSGTATVRDLGSTWSNTGTLSVGGSGTGTLNIQNLGLVNVASTLSIGSLGTVNLNGGILRFNGYSRSGTFNYTSGTVQLAGDRVFGADLAIPDLFGATPSIPSGKDLEIEGGMDFRINTSVTGGTLRSQANNNFTRIGFGSSATLAISNGGTVVGNGQVLIGSPNVASHSGTVTISGAGSSLTSNGDFTIGPLGSGTLQVSSGGSLTSGANALLATGSGSIATVTVTDANSAWTIAGGLAVGATGMGTVTIKDQGLVYVGTDLSIPTLGSSVNVQGGTLRFNTISSGLSRINFTSGTIQLAGNRTIGADSTINTLFGTPGVIPTGKGLTVEGTSTLSQPLTIAGGTFKANALAVGAGGALDFSRGVLELAGGTITGLPNLAVPTSGEFRANGVQSLRIVGAAGSMITATGNLTLGDSTAFNGFYTDGVLGIGNNIVTLNDANDAAFDTGSLVTIGSGASPGTLNAANGLTLDFGGNMTGYGTVNTPNNIAKPLINNGHITGNSVAQAITLGGYVKGVGTFDNVNFTGAFSPGLSPTILTVGNIALSSTSSLIMELGGTSPGGGYDQIQSSGALAFGGTLQVSLINSFAPAAGQSFNLFDWLSTSGNFAALQLPTLAGLTWNTSQLYTAGVLSIDAPGIPGDYNNNGVVDAADFIVWRKNQGTTNTLPNDPTGGTIGASQYNTWRTHFGQPSGSGLGAAASAAVPEPAALVMLIFAAAGWCLRRRRTA